MPKSLKYFICLLIASAMISLPAQARTDSIKAKMRGLVNQAMSFAERMPREKVFVHLDNTGYFKHDKIWFQCYVVEGIDNAPTRLSNTLYVELLNPRGVVVARHILKIDNGRCHGSFSLNHLPFYSGFYEIRAYTKYMLNFGESAVYSRVIPVFEKPRKEGDYSDWKMSRVTSRYPGTRQATKAGPKVEMRFFPEGGRMVAGTRGKVAFEITGPYGSPLDGSGFVIDQFSGDTVTYINTLHEGRGVFELTPLSTGKYQAVISYGSNGSTHKFNLPDPSADGLGLSVDNVSSPDSIFVTILPGASSPGPVGVAISVRGFLWSYSLVDLTGKRTFALSSKDMPSGVSVISLFGPNGQTLAERMIFINNGGYGSVSAVLESSKLLPGIKADLEITALDPDHNPAALLPVSVSVSDADNAVDYQGSLLSELLLSSEIKGYVRDPMQYFRSDADSSRRNLDLLMMVQGWRCYSWEEMAGIKPIHRQYNPERAIDLEGKIVSFVRGIPKPDVDVSVMLAEKNVPDSMRHNFTELLTTDSSGMFNISYDLYGKWSLIMSVSENGKKKDHRIILNRLFSPSPRKYEPAEITVENFITHNPETSDLTSGIDSLNLIDDNQERSDQIVDSLTAGTVKLNEVGIVGKRSREADIYKARSKSLIYYDMQEEIGNITDNGKIVGKDLFDVLQNINPGFRREFSRGEERPIYKTRKPLFVINYKQSFLQDSLDYTFLYPEDIKSIYITEDPVIMLKYADPTFTMFDIDLAYSCAVLIETFDDQKGPAAKGTRMQTVEGYTLPEEFINIDSPALLDNPDFRRTLYWNPAITTGPDGKAHIEFYNNSTCRNVRISVSGIDAKGNIYSY